MVSPLQVEVEVQNHFWDQPIAENYPVPIALETWEYWFQRWLEHLHPDLPYSAYELSIRLTTDAEIQALNAQYRQQDKPTDVLAFAALEAVYPHTEALQALPAYLGDIVISVETAQAQAEHQHHPLTQELAWLAAHALLHLLGWDHPDELSLTQMLQQQDALLQAIGLPGVYAEMGR